jgi:hypothetical protein
MSRQEVAGIVFGLAFLVPCVGMVTLIALAIWATRDEDDPL